MSFALLGMDPFKGEKFVPTEDGLGKLSNTANLIAIFERSLKLTTNKLLQKENPETIRPIARTRREAMKFRRSKAAVFLFSVTLGNWLSGDRTGNYSVVQQRYISLVVLIILLISTLRLSN